MPSTTNLCPHSKERGRRMACRMVPEERLELSRGCPHGFLKPACLPIPPLRRGWPAQYCSELRVFFQLAPRRVRHGGVVSHGKLRRKRVPLRRRDALCNRINLIGETPHALKQPEQRLRRIQRPAERRQPPRAIREIPRVRHVDAVQFHLITDLPAQLEILAGAAALCAPGIPRAGNATGHGR